MTKVYLIRHGESEGNLNKFFQGQLDIPLSELGIKQAELTAEFFKDKDVDCVYSSDLGRAVITAEKIAKSKDVAVISHKGLREIDGGQWQGVPFDILAKEFEGYKVWLETIGLSVCPGGESYREMQERMKNTLEEIVSENKGKTIVVVSHGGTIRALSALWLGIGLDRIHEIPWVSNSSVSTVEYRDDGSVNVIELGYDGHLEGLVTRFGLNV